MVVHPLVALLQSRGMSQRRLAERTGLSQGFISDVIRGRRKPGREALQRIAVALGMTPGELFDVLVGASQSPAPSMPERGDEGQSAYRDDLSREAKAA